jgi:hypothetical protein
MNKKHDNKNSWDEILDPYKESIQLGELQGREAGLKAGFDDGFQLGKVKALEFGIELGYIRRIVSCWISMMLEQHDNDGSRHNVNIETIKNRVSRMKNVIELIDTFPSADIIFSQVGTHDDSQTPSQDSFNTITNTPTIISATSTSTQDDSITRHIHRIRTQFKLLTVQMKVPYLALKNVMDASEKKGIIATAQTPGEITTSTTTTTTTKNTLTRNDMSKDEEW